MYRCRDLPVYHCFFECTGYLIHADTDRRLHHSINKTGLPWFHGTRPCDRTRCNFLCVWCACFLCTVQNYGIRHTGNTPELKKRYVHPYGRTPDPLLWHSPTWWYYVNLYERYWYPAPDDQSEYPAGFKQCGYDCQCPWRHDRFKHSTDDHHTFYGWSHALCHQSGRWCQCQVLYRPTAWYRHGQRLYWRDDEWPEGSKGLYPWGRKYCRLQQAEWPVIWKCW